MEVVVLDSPRVVVGKVVDDDAIATQVRDVSEGLVAVRAVDVHYDVSVEGILSGVCVLQFVAPDESVVVQVVDEDPRLGDDFGVAEDVRDTGIHNPESVASISSNAEHGRDRFALLFRVYAVGLEARVGDESW